MLIAKGVNCKTCAHVMYETATLYLDHRSAAPEVRAFAGGKVGIFSAGCPGVDGPNEDACAVVPAWPKCGVLVLADGMGGGTDGHLAAELAVKSMANSVWTEFNGDTMLRTVILNAFENANEAVRALPGSATTLAAVEIQGNTIRPYHAGDSAVLVVGGRGKIKHQSISHSPVAYGVEAGLLDASEALHHDERHIVSNMIGSPSMRIEIGPTITLARLDTVVLASDGLTDNLHVEEIAEHARLRPLTRAMSALAEHATARMTEAADGHPSKPDDLTFLLYRL